MSSKMPLIPGEELIMSSNNDTLRLTNLRILANVKIGKIRSHSSITLDSVESCAYLTINALWLLIVGIISFLFAMRGARGPMLVVFLGVGVIFTIGYFLSRGGAIIIRSGGGKDIRVRAKGIAPDAVLEFLSEVDKAKIKRVNQLHNLG